MKEILVDVGSECIRTAFSEDGRLLELIVDFYDACSVAGNIYQGTVRTILPNQFAFIDIGLEKNGFLNLADSKERGAQVKRGQDMLVQVLKDPSGTKGAYLTSEISVSSNLAVLIKLNEPSLKTGVSKKITSDVQRERLSNILGDLLPDGYGVIARTEAAEADEKELKEDIEMLLQQMESIIKLSRHIKAPSVILGEPLVALRHLKELFSADIERIVINSEKEASQLKSDERYAKKVIVYNEPEPIFEHFCLENQIEKALCKKVWLKSGGFLVIEQTESCVVIDVNTGKFTGITDHGHSIHRTNLEAACEIAYQIRLRNLSGMIIIDFIGVKNNEDRDMLLKCLEKEIKKDRITVNLVETSMLELVILTRKKTREPLGGVLLRECPHCGGAGKIKKK